MKLRITITAALLAALAVPSAGHAAVPLQNAQPKPPSSAAVKQAQATAQFSATPVFHDANGKTISEQAFNAAVQNGQRFTSKPDMQARAIAMTLLPPGVNTPGSMSAADMASSGVTLLLIDGVHYEVVFHDVHGKTIDQKTFAANAAQHQRYTSNLDKKNDKAILTLLPIGVNQHGSQLTSDWVMSSPGNLAPAPKPGTEFAGFDLPEVGGGRIDAAQLKGKPYIVDFFFAECIGCIAELPVLNAFHKQYPRQRVIALTFDDAETAAGFVKQRHFDWPVAYAGKTFIDKLGIKVYPAMVLVGGDGKVLATRIGADSGLTPAKLEQWVASGGKGPHTSCMAH